MDPILLCIVVGLWVTHLVQEAPYAIRGKTSPRAQLRIQKAANKAAGHSGGGSRPPWEGTSRHAGRDFWANLWHDSWDGAHATRTRIRTKRAEKIAAGTHWRQKAGLGLRVGGKAAGRAIAKAGKVGGVGIAAGAVGATRLGAAGVRRLHSANENGDAAPTGARVLDPAETGRYLPATNQTAAVQESGLGWPQASAQDRPAPMAVPHRTPDQEQPAARWPGPVDLEAFEADLASADPQPALDADLRDADGDTEELTPTERNTPAMTSTPVSGEITDINAAIAFANTMKAETEKLSVEVETSAASLQSHEVSGRPIELLGSAQELASSLASAFGELEAELTRHLAIAEAYASVGNDAGSKEFNTSA